jgi:hypothetical protein
MSKGYFSRFGNIPATNQTRMRNGVTRLGERTMSNQWDAQIFGFLSFMRSEVEKSRLSICRFRIYFASTKL